jgi:hypothetical protein
MTAKFVVRAGMAFASLLSACMAYSQQPAPPAAAGRGAASGLAPGGSGARRAGGSAPSRASEASPSDYEAPDTTGGANYQHSHAGNLHNVSLLCSAARRPPYSRLGDLINDPQRVERAGISDEWQ